MTNTRLGSRINSITVSVCNFGLRRSWYLFEARSYICPDGDMVPTIANPALCFEFTTLKDVLSVYTRLLVHLDMNERTAVFRVNSVDAEKRP